MNSLKFQTLFLEKDIRVLSSDLFQSDLILKILYRCWDNRENLAEFRQFVFKICSFSHPSSFSSN